MYEKFVRMEKVVTLDNAIANGLRSFRYPVVSRKSFRYSSKVTSLLGNFPVRVTLVISLLSHNNPLPDNSMVIFVFMI